MRPTWVLPGAALLVTTAMPSSSRPSRKCSRRERSWSGHKGSPQLMRVSMRKSPQSYDGTCPEGQPGHADTNVIVKPYFPDGALAFCYAAGSRSNCRFTASSATTAAGTRCRHPEVRTLRGPYPARSVPEKGGRAAHGVPDATGSPLCHRLSGFAVPSATVPSLRLRMVSHSAKLAGLTSP